MRPENPKTWNWDDVNEALREIAVLENSDADKKRKADAEQMRIKDEYERFKKNRAHSKKELSAQIKKAFTGLKKTLPHGAKSKELSWGIVGQRAVESVTFDTGVKEPDAIARAEAAGFHTAVKVERRLLREVLKAKGIEALAKCGLHISRQERFFIETKRELDGKGERTKG